MRKIRTFLAIVLAFGVVMSLTACGGQNNAASSDANSANSGDSHG